MTDGVVLLIPQVLVTSKLLGREWVTQYGTFSWVGWENRDGQGPRYGEVDASGAREYTAGRIIFTPRIGTDEESAAITLDALTGLMGIADDFWGERLSVVTVPPELLPAAVLYAEDMAEVFDAEAPSLMGRIMGASDAVFVGDTAPEWALDRLGVALADPTGLLPALVYVFESRDQFRFVEGDIALVRREPNAVPQSPIDTIRMETAFHNAYKAVEALLGGEPPKDPRRLRERLLSRSIDPDAIAGFDSMQQTMLDRVVGLQATRDKRSAHGGRTGVTSKAITYFELMDAQYGAAYAVRRSIEGLGDAAIHRR